MSEYGPIEVKRRQGDEAFHDNDRHLGFDLIEFWRWSCSDLVSNATRGILAEYLVAQALGVAQGVREEWAAYDLTTPDNTHIEVKSAAYIQSWHQQRLSRISFSISKSRAWQRETNRYSHLLRRQADVYVFALLAHQHQSTLDPLDVSQWQFFVVPTCELDKCFPNQRSITLSSLRSLAGQSIAYADLKNAVHNAAEIQRQHTSGSVNSPSLSDASQAASRFSDDSVLTFLFFSQAGLDRRGGSGHSGDRLAIKSIQLRLTRS